MSINLTDSHVRYSRIIDFGPIDETLATIDKV